MKLKVKISRVKFSFYVDEMTNKSQINAQISVSFVPILVNKKMTFSVYKCGDFNNSFDNTQYTVFILCEYNDKTLVKMVAVSELT